MSDALTEFQDRLKERIKGDIGELMPDAVIKEMIEKVLSEEFTQHRRVVDTESSSSYGTRYKMVPPLLLEYLQPQMNDIIKRCVIEYLAANPGKLEAMIEQQIGTQIGEFLQKAVSTLFRSHFDSFKYSLINELRQTP